MKRRSFVKASLLSSSLSVIIPVSARSAAAGTGKKSSRQYYELRVYSFKNEAQQKLTEAYFENAAIPALNRMGSKNIGVFTELKTDVQTKLYVVIPYESIEAFLRAEEKLSTDPVYAAAGAAYINAPATEPAYDRIESSLLYAFAKMPVIAVPDKKPRIFELRRYESASEAAGKKKIEMFNDAGEIAIFKRVGLGPVLFGETIIGAMRPNLTYLLAYDDMAAHDQHWKLFGSDPQWKQIKAIPEYADGKIVSRITAVFLLPAAYSQL
ncbi:MAG: NIPSNAP family protein [Chitinophagaceae bacterium]